MRKNGAGGMCCPFSVRWWEPRHGIYRRWGSFPRSSRWYLPPLARLRRGVAGGDPVTAICRTSGVPWLSCVHHGSGVRDSVGLDPHERHRNLVGKVVVEAVPAGPILLVDDIVTTGSTIEATALALTARGGTVVGALTLAAA